MPKAHPIPRCARDELGVYGPALHILLSVLILHHHARLAPRPAPLGQRTLHPCRGDRKGRRSRKARGQLHQARVRVLHNPDVYKRLHSRVALVVAELQRPAPSMS